MPSSGRLFLEETYLDTLTRKRDVQCTAGKLDRGKIKCFVFSVYTRAETPTRRQPVTGAPFSSMRLVNVIAEPGYIQP